MMNHTPAARSVNRLDPHRASIGAVAPMLALGLWLAFAKAGWAQPATEAAPALLDSTIVAGEAEAQAPDKRGLNKYNEFDLGFTTLRLGYGLMFDFNSYSQDDESKQQFEDLESDVDLRDFRLLFKGKFKTERPLSWTTGIMYDGAADDWHFRQTGLMIGVPEISSSFFIGRCKEGYSQYKVMVGYDLWTAERSPFLDAFVPILGDGIKWSWASPRRHVLASLAYYNDALGEDEKFATYDQQFVWRVAYLPVVTEKGPLAHLAVMGREAEPDEGQFQAKSRPEDFLAPFFVDTGKFDSDHARTLGFEAYYRNGPWILGGEYGWQSMDAPTAGDPMFHGANIAVDWLVTGETRGYNLAGGFFKNVVPKKTVFEGGPGALELGLNYSYIDLDDGNLTGGKFWRISPVLKWHLMDYNMVELGYGYGALDRFDLEGKTHFFHFRLFSGL
jgi:phosphate-selective porin OprO/OprP